MADGEIHKAMEVVNYARRAGWPEPLIRMAAAIAMAESRGYQNRRGDTGINTGVYGDSLGMMQLRSQFEQMGTGGPRDESRILDPLENMRAALELYRGDDFEYNGKTFYEPDRGWEAWSTYTNGAYKNFLPMVDRAIGLVGRAR